MVQKTIIYVSLGVLAIFVSLWTIHMQAGLFAAVAPFLAAAEIARRTHQAEAQPPTAGTFIIPPVAFITSIGYLFRDNISLPATRVITFGAVGA